MRPYNRLCLGDCKDTIKEKMHIINLINADENDERFSETLTAVYDYLYLAVASLDSVVADAQKDST